MTDITSAVRAACECVIPGVPRHREAKPVHHCGWPDQCSCRILPEQVKAAVRAYLNIPAATEAQSREAG